MLGGHLDSWMPVPAPPTTAREPSWPWRPCASSRPSTSSPAVPSASPSGPARKRASSAPRLRHQHFGSAKLSTEPDQMQLPEFMRRAVGPSRSSPSRSSSPATSTSITAPARFAASTPRATRPSRPSSPSGSPAQGPWRHHHHQPQHRRHRSPQLRRVGIPASSSSRTCWTTSRGPITPTRMCRAPPAADLKQIAVVEAIFVYNTASATRCCPASPCPSPTSTRRSAPPRRLPRRSSPRGASQEIAPLRTGSKRHRHGRSRADDFPGELSILQTKQLCHPEHLDSHRRVTAGMNRRQLANSRFPRSGS